METLFALFLLAATGTMGFRSSQERIGAEFWMELTLRWSVTFYGIFFLLGLVDFLLKLPIVSIRYAGSLAALLFVGQATHRLIRRPTSLALRPWNSAAPSVAMCNVTLLSRKAARISLVATSAVGLLVVAMALFGFPLGFEAHAYHIPLGIEFFRNHSLLAFAASGSPQDAGYTFTYPANASIWYGFLLRWLPERLVAIAQFPFIVLLAVSIHANCRLLGADRAASLMAATATFSIPMLAFGSLELGSDIAGLAFASIAIYFVARYPEGGSRTFWLAGLAIGLAFGFKALHINAMAILGLLLLCRTLAEDIRRPGEIALGTTLKAIALYSAGTFIMAGFWVARNWIFHGNPLYPVHLGSLFNAFGFAPAWDYDFAAVSGSEGEWVKSTVAWLWYPWQEWHYIDQNFKASAGTGVYFAAIVIPTSLIAALAAGRSCGHGLVRLFLLGAVLIFLLWMLEGVREPRYALASIAFLLPVSALMISRAHFGGRRLLDVIGLSALALMLLVVFSQKLVEFGDRILYSHLTTRHGFYEYPVAIDELPDGSVILNLATRPRNYSLYGRNLNNGVVPFLEARGRVISSSYRGNGAPRTDRIALRSRELKARHITHVYLEGDIALTSDECWKFVEIARMALNPLNGVPLPAPRILLAASECE